MEEKIKKPRKKRLFKYSIEDMQAFAKTKGGKCLSDEYTGVINKLQWQCKEGHTWFAIVNDVINHDTWCRKCSDIKNTNNKRLTIEKMKQLAKERGGKCLSEKYVSILSKIEWQCIDGHIWNETPKSIMQGSWCPACYSIRRGVKNLGYLETFQKIALERNGKCLSTEYIKMRIKLKWQCNKGHIWMAMPNNIKKGGWCPFCQSNSKHSIEAIQLIAKIYGGKCLSKEYIPKKPLTWECSKGHIFERYLDNIKRGHWCSICRREAKKAAKKLLQDSEKIV